jgi:hypothetical protein
MKSAAQDIGRSADHGHPGVPERDQVLHRAQTAGPVGGPDRRNARGRRTGRVHGDDRDAELVEATVLAGRQLGQDQQYAVGAAGFQTVEPPVVRAGAVAAVHRGDGHAGAEAVGDLLHPGQDGHRPWAAEIHEDQVDQAGLVARPVAVRVVAVLDEQLLDRLAGARRDIRPAVDDLGHGGHRHSGGCRDLRHRRPSALHCCLPYRKFKRV